MSVTEIRIRRADPEADRDRVLAVLSRNLPAAASAARYAWLYLANPAGRSCVWLMEEARTGEPVGTSAGHPKRVRVHGRIETALNLGDFAIDRAYRALGPALKLLRATLQPVEDGEFAFSYEHPSDAMLAVYRRMGGREVGRTERWVRPLEATSTLVRRWGDGVSVRLLGIAGDAALRARDALGRRRHAAQIGLHAGECGPEFDRLDEALAGDTAVRLVRSSEHLAWRYLRSEIARHQILCARAGGELRGYLVFRHEPDGVLSVVDLVSGPDPGLTAALIAELVFHGRALGSRAVWATVLAGSPAARVFPGLDFRRRDCGPGMVIHGPSAAAEALETLRNPTRWWTLEGDQDV